MHLVEHNMDFSSAAASNQHCLEFRTAPSEPDGVQGDYCNDLLCSSPERFRKASTFNILDVENCVGLQESNQAVEKPVSLKKIIVWRDSKM